MKLAGEDAERVCEQILHLARTHGYTKLFAKVPATQADPFIAHGFTEEARIPLLYGGTVDGVFCSRFLDPVRARLDREEERKVRDIIELARKRETADPTEHPLPDVLRVLRDGDMHALAALYREVFTSYPFPIHDAEYLRQTLRDDALNYFGVFEQGRLVAASSAEMDHSGENTEMTDFATRPDRRGKGYAQHLLYAMEQAMEQRGHTVVFTIARAMSPGMNITFSRAGYSFAGTLVHNTHIAGSIESMNVWYRRLGGTADKLLS
jgi:putative beta-lysine N-acetyltransferase